MQPSEANPLAFFAENVDRWGAAEWFNRLAKAIREQDKAVIAKDDIAFETYRMIAASSAMALVREFEPQVRAALAQGAGVKPAPSGTAYAFMWSMFKDGSLFDRRLTFTKDDPFAAPHLAADGFTSVCVPLFASPPEELERVKRERDDLRALSAKYWRNMHRLWDRAQGYDPDDKEEGQFCRDCADENGRCPQNGFPCDPQAAAEERIVKLFSRALAAESQLAEARAQLAVLSREGGR